MAHRFTCSNRKFGKTSKSLKSLSETAKLNTTLAACS